MRWPRSSDSSMRSPSPGSSQRETSSARSGRCVEEPAQPRRRSRAAASADRARRAPRPRRAGSARPSSAPAAARALPSGRFEHVVVELVLLVPQADAVAADVRHRLGDVAGNARRTWSRCPRRRGRPCASSSAMRIRFERVHRHPGGAVGLVDVAAGRQRLASGRRRRYCRGRGSRPGRCCGRRRPCGSPTR